MKVAAVASTLVIAGASGVSSLSKLPYWRRKKIQLLIAGSGTMLQLNTALVRAYEQQYGDTDVVLEAGGSTVGLIALKSGAIDVAAVSKEIVEVENDTFVRDYLIAKDGVVFAAHQSRELHSLTRTQIKALLSGEITNWKQLGGADGMIRLLSRKRGSAVRRFIELEVVKDLELGTEFEEFNSANEMIQALASDPLAIAYFAMNELDQNQQKSLHIVSIDQIAPTNSSLLSGRYPYTQSLYHVMTLDSAPSAHNFIHFVISPLGQRIITQQNFIAVY